MLQGNCGAKRKDGDIADSTRSQNGPTGKAENTSPAERGGKTGKLQEPTVLPATGTARQGSPLLQRGGTVLALLDTPSPVHRPSPIRGADVDKQAAGRT